MASALVCGLSATAQKVYKPKANTFGIEVQMNPFDQDGKTFQLDGLKMRYFVTDKDAVRLKLGFSVDKEKYTPDTDEDPYRYTTSGNVSIAVAYERHFDLAPRLSAYVGGEVGIDREFAKAKNFTDDDNWTKYSNYDGTNRGRFGFQINAITGLDFYVYKGLYIGTELGLGVSSYKTLEAKTTTCVANVETEVKTKDSTRNTTAKFEIEPVLRLGWNF